MFRHVLKGGPESDHLSPEAGTEAPAGSRSSEILQRALRCLLQCFMYSVHLRSPNPPVKSVQIHVAHWRRCEVLTFGAQSPIGRGVSLGGLMSSGNVTSRVDHLSWGQTGQGPRLHRRGHPGGPSGLRTDPDPFRPRLQSVLRVRFCHH